MEYTKAWLKGLGIYLGFTALSWALVFLIGYVVYRGVLSFLALYET